MCKKNSNFVRKFVCMHRMVSIIIPIYNASFYLPACLLSLQSQRSPEPLEFIRVDDGSTDGSLSIARSAAASDPRITVIAQPHAGQSAARNRGIEAAKGGYIAFVDADDRLEPEWTARHLSAIEGADYVQSGYKRIDSQKSKDRCAQSSKTAAFRAEIPAKRPKNRYQFTSPCMRLYRREAIEGMRFEEGMIYEDVIWSVDLWLRKLRCRLTDNTGYLYTFNPASTTSRPHPDAQRVVFQKLRERAAHASLRGRCIILYTILRLKIHFLRQ